MSQAGLEVVVLLAQIPRYYDYRHATIHLTQERSFYLVYCLFYYISFKVFFLNPTSVLWAPPPQVHVILIIPFIGDLTVLFHLLISGVVWGYFSKEVLVVGEMLFFVVSSFFPTEGWIILMTLPISNCCYCSVFLVSPAWNSVLEEMLGFWVLPFFL